MGGERGGWWRVQTGKQERRAGKGGQSLRLANFVCLLACCSYLKLCHIFDHLWPGLRDLDSVGSGPALPDSEKGLCVDN